MVTKKFYNIEEMSAMLGKSIGSIYGHLARKQWDAVPPPMKLGRRLAWLCTSVDNWIDEKIAQIMAEKEAYERHFQAVPKKRGRPRKAEARNRV